MLKSLIKLFHLKTKNKMKKSLYFLITIPSTATQTIVNKIAGNFTQEDAVNLTMQKFSVDNAGVETPITPITPLPQDNDVRTTLINAIRPVLIAYYGSW